MLDEAEKNLGVGVSKSEHRLLLSLGIMVMGYLTLAQGFSLAPPSGSSALPQASTHHSQDHSLQKQSFNSPVLVYLQKSTAPAGGPIVLCCPCLGTVQLTLCLSRQGTKGAKFLLV